MGEKINPSMFYIFPLFNFGNRPEHNQVESRFYPSSLLFEATLYSINFERNLSSIFQTFQLSDYVILHRKRESWRDS